MTSSLDVLRGIQTPSILHLPPGVASLAAATEAIELAESCELFLDESQCITLQAAMGERADHKWAAFEVADIEPRQNGKGDTVMVAEAHGLFIAGDNLQLHTAHEAATANESFLRMEAFISNNSELRAQVARFRYGNGDHAVELKSGGRLLYKTRTGGAARGFAGASRLVYDEALFLQAKQVAASLATLARGHNPQMWALSSAALSTSTFLHALRKRAISANAGRLAYLEHTAEEISLGPDGRIVSNRDRIDLGDRRLWAIANPAMNHPDHGISEEFIESEQRAQSADPDGWARERLGVFDPPADELLLADAKLPADRWSATTTVELVAAEPGKVTIAFDVSRDGEWSSIAVGLGSMQAPYVEVVEHRQGVGWLPDRLVELVQTWQPLAVGCNGAGPAGAQVGSVLQAFAAARIDANLLTQLATNAYKQACGGFYTDVVEGRLKHPRDQGPLDRAAADAAERVLGDAWAWDRRSATVPISPLVAVTIARALLPTGAEWHAGSVYDLDDFVEED